MKFFAVGLILGLVIGGSFTFLSDSKPKRVQDIDHCTAIKPTQPEIIVQKDCTERTNEIDIQKIEKAFLLFLASIGIKKDYADSIQMIVKNPESFKQVELKEEDIAQVPTTSKVFRYGRDEAIKKYDLRESIRGLEDYDSDLSKNINFILKSPAVFFATSKIISSMKKLRRYNGQYIGKLYRLHGKYKGKVEDVEISIEYWRKGRNDIDGKFTSILTRDGVVYSESNGNGANNDLYLNPQNSNELIIKVKPGMYFHFLSQQLQRANVYDEGEFIGVSTLKKL